MARDLDKWYNEIVENFVQGKFDGKTLFRKPRKIVKTISEAKVLMMLCNERISRIQDAIKENYQISDWNLYKWSEKDRALHLAELVKGKLVEDYPIFRGETLGKDLGII